MEQLSTTEKGYDARWERLRRWVVRRWVRENGWVCPGFMREAHPNRDLTGHHVEAISEGGDNVPSPAGVKVLCRGCNAREAHYRRNPWKRCPIGLTCKALPTGSPVCCAGGA